MGWGEGFSWPGDLFELLPEDFEPFSILPLRVLDANLMRRHPGTPDTPVCGLNQSDDNPTLDVSVRPGVGLPPI